MMMLALLLVTWGRLRLLDLPLERDEGEYAYMAQMMLDGVAPYGTAANMKLPGTSAAYALIFLVFGESVRAIHLGLLLVDLMTCAGLFLVARRLFSAMAGIAAAASYLLLVSGVGVLGLWAHATHFVVLPAVVAVWLLLQGEVSLRQTALVGAGALMGVAFLMKQHGILFGVFGAAWVISRPTGSRWRSVTLYLAALAVPWLLTCAYLWHAGVFGRFWFWTVTYAAAYSTQTTLSVGLDSLTYGIREATGQNRAIWGLAAIGAVALGTSWRKEPKTAGVVLGFLLFSIAAVCPGWYFRNHYFVLLLPATALCLAATFTVKSRWTPWLIGAGLLFSVFEQRTWLFRMSNDEIMAEVYGDSPFIPAQEVGTYIREHSWAHAKVLVLGSEPEIFFYSGRRAATPYLYMYPLMESHAYATQMQAEFIRSAEASAADYAVVVNVETSWQREHGSKTVLFDWWSGVGSKHYRVIGVAELEGSRWQVRWNPQARPHSRTNMVILERKD